MALGPMFPVIRAVAPCLATSWAACMPAPLVAMTQELGTEFSLMLSKSTITKNGHRPNLGSIGASRPDAPAVTHTFIETSLNFILFEYPAACCGACRCHYVFLNAQSTIMLICDVIFKAFGSLNLIFLFHLIIDQFLQCSCLSLKCLHSGFSEGVARSLAGEVLSTENDVRFIGQ